MNKNKTVALEYYKKFSNVEGNKHIAELFALETIVKLLRSYNPTSILELGSGIGTITYTITDFMNSNHKTYSYHATEANEYCLTQLPKNLGANFNNIQLYESFESIPKGTKYDFVIVDGSDASLKKIKNSLSEHPVIYVEGFRMSQVDTLRELFPKNLFTTVISGYRNPDFGPKSSEKWSGGGQLIFVNPTPKQFFQFLRYRLLTFIKYKFIRKLK